MVTGILWGLLLPLLGTVAGATVSLGLPLKGEKIRKSMTGFAAGAMLAASVWSLLLPAMAGGKWVALAGMALGIGFLEGADQWMLRKHGSRIAPEKMLVLAMVLHNLPEGMAVGSGLAGWMAGEMVGKQEALAISLGIAAQNVPDGVVIVLPLMALGMSRWQAFGWGAVSGVAELAAAASMLLFAAAITPLLPVLLGFAAGAMIHVVLRELSPQMQENGPAMGWFLVGFGLLMG